MVVSLLRQTCAKGLPNGVPGDPDKSNPLHRTILESIAELLLKDYVKWIGGPQIGETLRVSSAW